MASVESELRADLGHALRQLKACIGEFSDRLLAERDRPLWVWGETEPVAARQRAVQVMCAMDYRPDQDPHRTRTAPGLMGISEAALTAAHAVNAAKGHLAETLRAMDGLTVTVTDPLTGERVKRPLHKVALAALGHPHFHRREALRRLECLTVAPESVGFTWARLPKIERISVREARRRLEERIQEAGQDAGLQRQWVRLAALASDEPLAVVHPAHVHPRANLAWLDEAGQLKRAQKRAVLPLLYPARPGARLPRFRPLPETPDVHRPRLRRRDVKVEDEPFLPAIHVHRYRDGASPRPH